MFVSLASPRHALTGRRNTPRSPPTIRTQSDANAWRFAACRSYGIGQHRMRRLIAEGLVTPRAIGRRSIVLFSELEEVLRKLPRTRSSKREECHVVAWQHQGKKWQSFCGPTSGRAKPVY